MTTTYLASVLATKTCSSCKEAKFLSEFTLNKAAKDGLQYKCKTCDVTYQKARRENNPNVNEYSRNYQKKRREDFDYRLQMLLNASKQRAKTKGREHTITLQDIKDKYPPDNHCPVFGFELEFNSEGFRETSPSIDRIDSSKGYTPENIQIISWKANRIKAYATVEDLEILVAFMKQGD
jgi:transcription elongation factor Elf1